MSGYTKEKPESIQQMFGTIAHKYDRANALMSMNMHKIWNRELIKLALRNGAPHTYLDLCAGTGEIAFELIRMSGATKEAFLLDFCPEMLACAQKKGQQVKDRQTAIRYIEADAQDIPLPSDSIDCVTVAYGIRNVGSPLQCAKSVYRVLKPSGIFAILELTQPTNKLMRMGHALYLNTALPVIGKWISSNKQAYQYLSKSIRTFIPPEQLEAALEEAGFKKTQRKSLLGGIATIITCEK